MGYPKRVNDKETFFCLIITSVFFLFVNIIKVKNLTSSMLIHNTADKNVNKTAEGFYRYVLAKGLNVKRISENKFRVSHLKWSCDINTSIAMSFHKRNVSWKDMFESRIVVLSKKTVFSSDTIRQKMGALPEDGTNITLVARQGNEKIPLHNVIIRLNSHGPLHARTTMIMTWSVHVKTITMCAREQPNDQIIRWTHYKPYGHDGNYGLWNTSQPMVVPEDVWGFENLTYYRGPLFFLKGAYFSGHFAECKPADGIGLSALNRVAHLKGDISTLGFSTRIDAYNRCNSMRFKLLVHELPWAYFVVNELTDSLQREYGRIKDFLKPDYIP